VCASLSSFVTLIVAPAGTLVAPPNLKSLMVMTALAAVVVVVVVAEGEPLAESDGDAAEELAEVGADASLDEVAVGSLEDAQPVSALKPRMPTTANPAALVLVFMR
jgi:hypothetical protein